MMKKISITLSKLQ